MGITILNIHEHTGICTHRDTQTQIKIHTDTHPHTDTHSHVHMHIHCTYIHTHMRMHMHTHAHTHTNTIPSGHSVRGTTTRGIRQSIGENKQTPAAYNNQSQLVERA